MAVLLSHADLISAVHLARFFQPASWDAVRVDFSDISHRRWCSVWRRCLVKIGPITSKDKSSSQTVTASRLNSTPMSFSMTGAERCVMTISLPPVAEVSMISWPSYKNAGKGSKCCFMLINHFAIQFNELPKPWTYTHNQHGSSARPKLEPRIRWSPNLPAVPIYPYNVGRKMRVKTPFHRMWFLKVGQKQLSISGNVFAIESLRSRTAGKPNQLKLRVNFHPEIITLSKEVSCLLSIRLTWRHALV